MIQYQKVLTWAQECIGQEFMVDGKMTGKDYSRFP